ncbi:MAG: tRNA uridine-5-carboxymethylaminomethyl(34) synthesis GTPase MnmE [Deltaproteobacteria bacterium]
MYESDTIAAIATPMGEGGIGIVRLSGSLCPEIARRILKRKADGPWESHRLYYGHVIDPESGMIVDESLCVLMKGPKSYTREDVLEIHCHGGSLATELVLELVLREGARLAEPGEFTKRAFLNGRIDLTQAEAVIDLIRAKTSAGQVAASEQLSGRLYSELMEAKKNLSSVLTHLEAYIDFPEEDIELSTKDGFIKNLTEVGTLLNRLVSSYEEGRIYRDGLTTVIVGRPNVGKSSLLNQLLKEKRAIVTSVPGTTRDVIEEYMNIRGVPLRLADTAGIRETEDLVEIEGVKLARETLGRADIVLFVLDGSQPITDDDRRLAGILKEKAVIMVINKSDLPKRVTREEIGELLIDKPVIYLSAENGEGMETLHEAIFKAAVHGKEASGGLIITRARHRDILHKGIVAVNASIQGIIGDASPEFISIDLRAALNSISDIVGETTPDDILDRIFSEFCIGK